MNKAVAIVNKNSKIYVAGHNGLVGSAIVRKLYQEGYSNLILKTHHELDLTQQNSCATFFAQIRPDYVILAAAKVGGIYANNKFRADFIYQNLMIQNNVIHQSYLTGVKKLLFLGSSCIYPKNSSQPLMENFLLNSELEYTNEPYAIAKIAGMKMCESYNLQYQTNFISVMPTNLYGINDNFDLQTAHVLPAMIRKIYLAKLLVNGDIVAIKNNLSVELSNEELIKLLNEYGISINDSNRVILKLWGSGKVYREFLHVDDMAAACLHILKKINFAGLVVNMKEIKNTHINIGCGSDIKIHDLAHLIAEQLDFKGEIKFDGTKLEGTYRKLLDVSKLKLLGWEATINLTQGLRDTIKWYLNQELSNG